MEKETTAGRPGNRSDAHVKIRRLCLKQDEAICHAKIGKLSEVRWYWSDGTLTGKGVDGPTLQGRETAVSCASLPTSSSTDHPNYRLVGYGVSSARHRRRCIGVRRRLTAIESSCRPSHVLDVPSPRSWMFPDLPSHALREFCLALADRASCQALEAGYPLPVGSP